MLLFSAACRETVLHDLSEQDANRVHLVLKKQKIEAKKEKSKNGWQISVSTDLLSKALAVIEDSKVLKTRESRTKDSSNAMLQSREQREQLLEQDRALEIESTLERIPGVLEARVHLYLPENSNLGLGAKQNPKSGSVFLIAKSKEVDRAHVAQLVAGAVGIQAQAISVMLSEQSDCYYCDSAADDSKTTATSSQLKLVRSPEMLLIAIALLSLAYLLAVYYRRKREKAEKFASLTLKHPNASEAANGETKADESISKLNGSAALFSAETLEDGVF